MSKLNQEEYIKMGRFLRKKRRQMGYSAENLADNSISSGSISNIERATKKVSRKKIDILCRKLGFSIEELPRLMQEDSYLEIQQKNKLLSIEGQLELLHPKKTYSLLKQVKIDEEDPLQILYLYIKGQCFYHREKWGTATNCFNQALDLILKFPEWADTNIRTGCLKELGRIAFFKDKDLEKALYYIDQAINSFKENGERSHLKYSSLISKALYLEKLDRTDESMDVLLDLWQQKEFINEIVVILLMYELRAILLLRKNHHSEAIEFAKEGLSIAQRNKEIERSVELFNTLGIIYMECNNFPEAEEKLLCAKELEGLVKQEHLLVSTYTKLGELYLKQENWEEAYSYLLKAIQLDSKEKDILRHIEALEIYGNYFFLQNKLEEAIEPYETALGLAEKHAFTKMERSILVKLGVCYEGTDKDKHKKFIEKLFKFEVELEMRKFLGGL
jgi:tetratricopeptide (TPR) repeat protein